MFDQLVAVVDFLLRFLPRIDVVTEKEAGLAWVRGKPRDIKPGRIFFYWPLWTEVEYIYLFPDPLDLATQALRLGDKEVAVSALVEYRITNPRAALVKRDIEEYIRCQAMSAVRNTLFGKTLRELAADESGIEEAMRKELQTSMYGYGVKIVQVYFSDITTCQTLFHFGQIPTQEQ